MHVLSLVAILPIHSSAVAAFTAPAGFPDGAYLVSVDVNSTATFERLELGAYTPMKRSTAASRARRQSE